MKALKILTLGLMATFLISIGQTLAQSAYIIHNEIDNEKWVNQTVYVIHNETLSAFHLNGSEIVDITEDFTTYTESDPPGVLTQTESRSTFTDLDRSDDNTYLYKSKSGLSDFEVEMVLNVQDVTFSTSKARVNAFFVVDDLDDYIDNMNNNNPQFGVGIRSLSSHDQYHLLLMETWLGTQYKNGNEVNNLNEGSTYYLYVKKAGSSLTAKVDNNADFSSPIETFSLTLRRDHDLDYLMIPQSVHYPSALETDGWIENVDFGETAGGFPDGGYLITDDLLENYTSKGPFSLIYNISIPSGCGFNCSISENRSSWTLLGDHSEGDYQFSYLAPYNWTALYVKFGFETDLIDTPILYDYHLTFYRECQGGGFNLEFGDLYWILTVIWLGLLALGKNRYPIMILGSVFGMVTGIYFLIEDTLIGFMLVLFNLAIFILTIRENK